MIGFQVDITPRIRATALFFLGTLLLWPIAIHAQVLPPIWNFSPSLYQADNQNWSVDQSDQGWMYFGNNGGLLEFNGVTWNRYLAPNGSVIRAVRAVGNRIYTGCYMEFGYWDTDFTGTREYHSLSASIADDLLPDEQFWHIHDLGNWIVFQSLQRIYAFNSETETFTVLPSSASRAQLFGGDTDLFYRKDDEGLMQLHNGQSKVVIPKEDLQEEVLVGMVKIKGQPGWLSESGLLFTLENGVVTRMNLRGLAAFPSLNIYHAVQLKDGSLALGTISEGLILLDVNGDFLYKIGKEEGLSNNTVLSVFEDEQQNLWLALDNGISVINRGSAFSEYKDKAGNLGVVYAAREFEGKLYLGTNQGLFWGTLDAPVFELVPGTEGQVWCIEEFGGVLLCGHNNGTYQIQNNSARLITGAPGTWNIKSVTDTDSLLIQGGYQGLSILKRNGSSWELRNALQGFGISSRFFEFVHGDRILVNHEYKGVFQLQVDQELTRVVDSSQTPAFGFGASLFRFRSNLYYANSSGVFRYTDPSGFVPDTVLNTLMHSGVDDPVGVLIPDESSQRLWGMGNRTIYSILPDPLGKSLRTQNIPVPEGFRQSIGVVGFECIVPLQDGRYLIGKTDGYLLLDLTKIRKTIPEVTISNANRYFYNTDSIQLLSLHQESVVLPYKEGNIQISYAVPVYDKFLEVEYQYWIEGLQETWTPWSTQTSARFENLSYGGYTMHVRARIGEYISEKEASFSFEVARPWYLTLWALSGFGLFSLGVVYMVHRSYRAYYRRQQALLQSRTRKKLKQKALKAQRKIVEMRNANLRQEIESKNRELAVSTMSIIKKNEFLNAIKEQLKKVSNTPEIRSVIRTIDQNINNEEDWEFFESAFNNADQDFLQNVKKRHPDLTPNDLKLCAYLRLNLSSKEIAPLLNISVRSVEVKRYRLRKKMGLDHEDSLTSYILSL